MSEDQAVQIQVADWRPIRDALDFAYQELGLVKEKDGNMSRYNATHWNIAVKMHEYNVRNLGKCLECKTDLNFYTVIRCLDCRSMLCEHCAPKHFGAGHQQRAAVSHPADAQDGYYGQGRP